MLNQRVIHLEKKLHLAHDHVDPNRVIMQKQIKDNEVICIEKTKELEIIDEKLRKIKEQ